MFVFLFVFFLNWGVLITSPTHKVKICHRGTLYIITFFFPNKIHLHRRQGLPSLISNCLNEHRWIVQLAIAMRKIPAEQKKSTVSVLLFFLTEMVPVLFEHINDRQWSGSFFSLSSTNDLLKSLYKREKERGRKREIHRPTLMYSRPALMWIERPALLSVAESTPENCSILEATRAFHGRTNDAHPHSTFYLRSACSIAWQRSPNRRSRKGRTDFSVRWKYSVHDFIQLKRYNDAKWKRNLTDKIFDFFFNKQNL